MIFVKQYGSKRSGTCYVTALLRRNFDSVQVLVHALGGKHQPPTDYAGWAGHKPHRRKYPGLYEAVRQQTVRVAIATKNPYAWVQSYIKAHRVWKPAFRQRFEADRVTTVQGLCAWWVAQNREWLDLPVPLKMAIRHEDLLSDFQGTMGRVARTLQLKPSHRQFVNIPKKMTPNDTVGRQTFDPGYYLTQRYVTDLADLIPVVTAAIDWDFAKQLNYHPVET